MDSEQLKSAKAQLALALAQGVSVAKWARTNDVTKMTAYRWAKEPDRPPAPVRVRPLRHPLRDSDARPSGPLHSNDVPQFQLHLKQVRSCILEEF